MNKPADNVDLDACVYEFEDEGRVDDFLPVVSWRFPPSVSYSDFTVEVTVDTTPSGDDGEANEETSAAVSSSSTRVYHVHKCVLAGGKCGSEYFRKLFASGMRENEERRAMIALPRSAANAFPSMLDYIYSGSFYARNGNALKHTGCHKCDNSYTVYACCSADAHKYCVALRYLSNYFGVRGMFEEVKHFVKDALNAHFSSGYDQVLQWKILWEEAKSYNDENILSVMVELGAKHMTYGRECTCILNFPSDFLKKVLVSPSLKHFGGYNGSNGINKIIYTLDKHEGKFDFETLIMLTKPSLMKQIPPETSTRLFRLLSKKEPSEGHSMVLELSDIRNRCIDAFVELWTGGSCARHGGSHYGPKRPKVFVRNEKDRKLTIPCIDMLCSILCGKDYTESPTDSESVKERLERKFGECKECCMQHKDCVFVFDTSFAAGVYTPGVGLKSVPGTYLKFEEIVLPPEKESEFVAESLDVGIHSETDRSQDTRPSRFYFKRDKTDGTWGLWVDWHEWTSSGSETHQVCSLLFKASSLANEDIPRNGWSDHVLGHVSDMQVWEGRHFWQNEED